jgi:hypothetical protein
MDTETSMPLLYPLRYHIDQFVKNMAGYSEPSRQLKIGQIKALADMLIHSGKTL